MARTNLRQTAPCLAVLAFAVLSSSCSRFDTYKPPRETSDGWKTASLEQAGLDFQPLRDLLRQIRREKFCNIHAILIAKDGRLVFEEYFPGYRFDSKDDRFRGTLTAGSSANPDCFASLAMTHAIGRSEDSGVPPTAQPS